MTIKSCSYENAINGAGKTIYSWAEIKNMLKTGHCLLFQKASRCALLSIVCVVLLAVALFGLVVLLILLGIRADRLEKEVDRLKLSLKNAPTTVSLFFFPQCKGSAD